MSNTTSLSSECTVAGPNPSSSRFIMSIPLLLSSYCMGIVKVRFVHHFHGLLYFSFLLPLLISFRYLRADDGFFTSVGAGRNFTTCLYFCIWVESSRLNSISLCSFYRFLPATTFRTRHRFYLYPSHSVSDLNIVFNRYSYSSHLISTSAIS